MDCWRRFQVADDRVLYLEDASGREAFPLPTDEYEALLRVVLGSDFAEALSSRRCPTVFDADLSIELTLASGTRSDPAPAGCIGRRGGSHPYAQLVWMLVDLKKKYLFCPDRHP